MRDQDRPDFDYTKLEMEIRGRSSCQKEQRSNTRWPNPATDEFWERLKRSLNIALIKAGNQTDIGTLYFNLQFVQSLILYFYEGPYFKLLRGLI